MPRTQRIATVIPLFAGVLLLAHVALFARYTVDDSFIFFRYARNLASGLGVAYNPGAQVEGFTSPAWLVLLAVGATAGLDPLIVSKVLGVAAGLATLLIVHATSRRLRRGSFRSLPSVVFLALCPLFAAWVPSGMDTALFALVVAGMTHGVVVAVDRERSPGALVALVALAFVVRPEGALLFALLFVAAGHLGLGAIRRPLLLAFGAVAIAITGLRLAWFGVPLPNTFYAKVHPTSGALTAGLENLGQLVSFLGPGVVILVLVGALRGGRAERFMALLVAVHTAYVVAVGGDVLGLRIHVPMLAPLALLIEGGFLAMFDALAHRGSVLTRGRAAVVFCSLVGLLYLGVAALEVWSAITRDVEQVDVSYVVLNSRNVESVLRPAARWVADRSEPGAAVAIDDIGAFGWDSGMALIDLYGLVDPPIAASLGTPGAVADEVFRRAPEWLVLRAGSRQMLQGDDVTDDPRLERYEELRTFRRASYGVTVFRRRALAGLERGE